MSLDRRKFLKYMGVAGAAAGASMLVSEGVKTKGKAAIGPTTAEAQTEAKEHRYEVKPGELDAYYGFWSGGHSGEVRIIGVPSMREIKRIPVFNIDVGTGYGVTNETKALLKGRFCGDTHHVHGSYNNGVYDGKYLFVNDKLNNRVARIRTDYMETDKIVDVPNIQGMHGLFTQRYPKTEWLVCNGEFQVPVPNTNPNQSPADYNGVHTIIDAEKMEIVCQILMDENMDLAATDYKGRYSMTTSYNPEKGVTVSEMLAFDEDFMLVFHWDRIRSALKDGKYKMVNGVKMLDGRAGKSDLTLRIPVPKNPHGINVSPDGKYAVCSGKVAPTCSVVEIDKIEDAFNGKIKPKECIVAQPFIGLGPLHTTYDGRGNAITSVFIDSTNVKWNIQKAIDNEKNPEEKKKNTHIVDVLDVTYQVGHIMATMAETKEADGQWLVSLNKFSKDRFLNVGPLKNECEQLVDITGDKLKLVHDSAAYIEPHDCIMVRRDIIEKHVKDRYNMFDNPLAVTKAGVERKGNKVTVKLTANAPVFGLSEVHLKKGEEVTVIVTNHDEISDLDHGFALSAYNINFVVAPFQTKSVTFTADKPGVYWAYCTNFCHALHLEMRMRFIIA
ncbi:MAG: nitrous-oxide reductase [Candidatus Magnetominusculus sp. LBB02]|nr:nitrous-oxide reductase [Candidatus Magnetominusculus sp. LBB02]